MPNPAGKKTISLLIPETLFSQAAKPVEFWKDLSAMFSELAESSPKWATIKAKHPRAYELLKVMP